MNDFLQVLEGTDDPDVLLRAAQWALVTRMPGTDANEVIGMALQVWGPEAVFMDGELR